MPPKKKKNDALVSDLRGRSVMESDMRDMLSSGMNINSLRTNDVLRKDEWKHYDLAVIKAAQDRLVGVADLMSRGLVLPIANGLGKTVLEYEDASDITDAEISMAGVTPGQNDRLVYDINYLPLPIVHKDFQINIRVLNSSRTTGVPADTAMAAMAAGKVADKLEEILFIGAGTYTFGGGTIYGYLDAPNTNSVTLSENWDVAAGAKTGAEIIADVVAMKQASIDAAHYGPFMLYLPTAYETVLDKDHTTGYPKTTRSRILEIAGIQGIKIADKLTANHVVLVQMTSDVVRMVEGLPLTTVEWETEGKMIFHFKVMTISVPQIRSNQANQSGITIRAA